MDSIDREPPDIPPDSSPGNTAPDPISRNILLYSSEHKTIKRKTINETIIAKKNRNESVFVEKMKDITKPQQFYSDKEVSTMFYKNAENIKNSSDRIQSSQASESQVQSFDFSSFSGNQDLFYIITYLCPFMDQDSSPVNNFTSILQWNINGCKDKFGELEMLIKEMKPLAITLQESHLSFTDNPEPRNYKVYRKDYYLGINHENRAEYDGIWLFKKANWTKYHQSIDFHKTIKLNSNSPSTDINQKDELGESNETGLLIIFT
ncbi:hypothetical protein M8J76_000355 [Diaphorina citri]|nr:hypothetical protein M8J76_000355 [Diaphorina citri]